MLRISIDSIYILFVYSNGFDDISFPVKYHLHGLQNEFMKEWIAPSVATLSMSTKIHRITFLFTCKLLYIFDTRLDFIKRIYAYERAHTCQNSIRGAYVLFKLHLDEETGNRQNLWTSKCEKRLWKTSEMAADWRLPNSFYEPCLYSTFSLTMLIS